MASPWIALAHDTPTKIEIAQIADALKVTMDDAGMKCIRFWIWCDQNIEDPGKVEPGHLVVTNVTAMSLDCVLGAPGFCRAYCDAGWGEIIEGRMFVRNFHYWGGKSAKTRLRNARNQGAKRAAVTNVTAARRQMSPRRGDISVTTEQNRTEEDDNSAPEGGGTNGAFVPEPEQRDPPPPLVTFSNLAGWDEIPEPIRDALGRFYGRAKNIDTDFLPSGYHRHAIAWWAQASADFPVVDADDVARRIDDLPGARWGKQAFPSGLLGAIVGQSDRGHIEYKNPAEAMLARIAKEDT